VVRRLDLVQGVQNATIIAGLVPNGLFLSIALAYAIAAVRIVRFGALVQQANAIESLSHVDVICLDKTGTLTTNQLQVAEVVGLTEDPDSLKHLLGIIVASTRDRNKTSEAIETAFPAEAHPIIAEAPFSSARKWSAAAFEDGSTTGSATLQGVYALGAPEMLRPYLDATVPWETINVQIQDRVEQGLRVLLVAHSFMREGLRLGAQDGQGEGEDARLPSGMAPLGLVVLSDELRPEARATLHSFIEMGVQPKIISGDHPETVAALARHAGLDGAAIRVVSGSELEMLDDAALAEIAETGTVFGRTTPQHKERLIRVLRSRGHYVAMIGDGVNDVLSLKQAQLAIAMHNGSQAARSVSDMVLMQDSFATLVPAVQEGQRVVSGMQDILKIILARVAAIGLLVVSSLALGPLPLALRQGSLITLLAVGIPTVLLAIWAHPEPASRSDLRRQLLHFVSAAVVVTAALGLLLFYGAIALDLGGAASPTAGFATVQTASLNIYALTHAQTAVAAFLVFSGLLLVIFVEPPTPWWTGGDRLSGDWRPTILAGSLAAVFIIVESVASLRDMFALAPLSLVECGLVSAAILLWLPLLRWLWRSESITRYLGMKPLDDASRRAGRCNARK
jgi:cation-transporting P-type ATPase E